MSVVRLEQALTSWRVRPAVHSLRGLRLLADAGVPARPELALVRSIVRSNQRLDPFDALVMANATTATAARHHLDSGFLGSLLLQESGFSPNALSSAGAVGIAQFTLDTAAQYGVDPFDWRDGIAGAGMLAGGYVAQYDGTYPDPYAAALAAYNAGPGTVAYYHGVPPYPETREYISDIYDRWSRIVRDETGIVRPQF